MQRTGWRHPARRLLVDPVDAGHVAELETALEVALDDVVRILHLPLGAGVACLVDHGLDLQAAQQAHEGTAYAGAAGVHHQMKGHAVHLLLGARLYGPQERLGHVHRALATGHVVHKDGAAAVVGEHVAGEALALDLLEVLGLVLVEHAGGHVLQTALALAGHIKQGADGGVDLPDVVGVVAGELLHRGRGTQLVRVQRIGAQGAGARPQAKALKQAFRQRFGACLLRGFQRLAHDRLIVRTSMPSFARVYLNRL